VAPAFAREKHSSSGTAGLAIEAVGPKNPRGLCALTVIDRRFDDGFRTQAELIDRLFAYRFEELDRSWGPRLGALERDVSALKKDVVIVCEGIAILLNRR
jgi:hypothetical protein